MRQAVEQIKQAYLQYMLAPNKPDQDLANTKRLYHQADQLVLAIETIISGGKMAEMQLKQLEQGQHKIYSVA